MVNRPALSVVIPSYNDPHCLRLTLRSLTRQTLPADEFEVVVACDGAADDYGSVEEESPGINLRITRLGRHCGRSAARNAGLATASGSTVLFLDSDCYADPDLLARHYAFHERQESPRVLLGGRYEIDWPQLGFLLRDDAIPDKLLDPFGNGEIRFIGERVADLTQYMETPWLFAHTSNSSASADVLAAVGGFHEDFGTRWGWEDLELYYRVYQHFGRDLRSFSYDTGAITYHLPQYRDVIRNYLEFFENEAVVKRLHPHYDWEFHSLRLPITVAAKVRYYREVIRGCLETGACRLAPVWSWLEPRVANAGERVLWIGTGTEEVPLRTEALTFDYAAPTSPRNFHLIGTKTPVPDGALDAVVSVDFWRCLQWEDLCAFLRESARIAQVALLVRTARADLPHRPMATRAELDFLARALAPEFDVRCDDEDGEISGVTVRRIPAPAS